MYTPFPRVCEIRRSGIPNAGLGVFALVDLKAGDIATEYGGLVVQNRDAKEQGIPDTHLRSLTKGYDSIDGRHGNPPLLPFEYFVRWNLLGSFVNDCFGSSFQYNCVYYRPSKNFGVIHPNDHCVSQRILIRIIADVKAGEELFANYGNSYHKRHFMPEPADLPVPFRTLQRANKAVEPVKKSANFSNPQGSPKKTVLK